MKCSWVFANGYQFDPIIPLDHVKNIGSSWGSWTTWRGCSTDNVLCNDIGKSRELIERAFQAVCNFYVPRQHYQKLGRPVGLKFYESEHNVDIDHIEDIIACHLAASGADIVLLCGFDFCLPTDVADQLEVHKLKNRHGALRSAMSNSTSQWVAIDYTETPDLAYSELDNFTCDSMDNVLNLLL